MADRIATNVSTKFESIQKYPSVVIALVNYEEDVSPDASGVRGRKEEDVVTEPKLKKSHLE